MNIYYRYDTKKLCDASGSEIYNANYYPRFPVQSSVAIDWYFLRLNTTTNVIEVANVSFVSAWSLALDDDFASATNVMARATNANINSTDAANGHLSALINTNTVKFISVTDGHDTVTCYGQLKALNSSAEKIEAFKFPIIADGDLDLNIDPPPEDETLYFTKAELLAILALLISSGTGAPATEYGSNGDFYINETNGYYYRKVAGSWVLKGNLTGQQGDPGGNAYCYIAYASDASGADFTMTFDADLDYIAILSTGTELPTPTASDFAGLWKNYKGVYGIQGEQGLQGEQGAQGLQGPAGANGTDPGIRFAFDSSPTTTEDPGTGDIRLNNASFASVTEIALSYSSGESGNPSVETFVKTWDDSTSTVKGFLIIKKPSAPQNFAIYSISGTITDGTTYARYTLTHISSSGLFTAADILSVQFARTGDKGADGSGTPTDEVWLNTSNGYGSTNTAVRRFTNIIKNNGSAITYTDSPTNGASFTINTTGIYAISYSDCMNTANNIVVSLNSPAAASNVPLANRLTMATTNASGYVVNCSCIIHLTATDVLRCATDAATNSESESKVQVIITRLC